MFSLSLERIITKELFGVPFISEAHAGMMEICDSQATVR